jgi:hypothetical protein
MADDSPADSQPDPASGQEHRHGDGANGTEALRPVLPFQPMFTEDHLRAARQQRAGSRRMRGIQVDVGVAWSQIYDLWDDAKAPIDGGEMQITSIDTQRLDDYVERYGRDSRKVKRATGIQRNTVLRGAWIATPVALYYITPRLLVSSRWQWDDLSLRAIQLTRRTGTLGIRPSESDREVEGLLPANGAKQLLTIAAFYGASADASGRGQSRDRGGRTAPATKPPGQGRASEVGDEHLPRE